MIAIIPWLQSALNFFLNRICVVTYGVPQGLFRVLHRSTQLIWIIWTWKPHLLDFIHITEYILSALPDNMEIRSPSGKHSHHESHMHWKMRCSPDHSSQCTWEMFSVEQSGSSAFCKACNMNESPWNYSKKIWCQHGSIKEYTDQLKMFESQIHHWPIVK